MLEPDPGQRHTELGRGGIGGTRKGGNGDTGDQIDGGGLGAASSEVSTIYADASAALGIAKRQGAGKLRHINVKTLWLQEKALQEELSYTKIKGEENPANGLTKHVRHELSQRYAKTTSIKLSADRADTSLRLAGQGVHSLKHAGCEWAHKRSHRGGSSNSNPSQIVGLVRPK